MARSSRSFTLAAKAKVSEKHAEYEKLEIPFIDPDALTKAGKKPKEPKERIVIASFPGDGLMFSMASSMSSEDAQSNPASGVKKFLRGALTPADFRFVWAEVEADRLTVEDDLMPLIGEMMELWSAVPTQQ